MKPRFINILMLSTLVSILFSCGSKHFIVEDIRHQRYTIDASYDLQPDAVAAAFIAPYKHRVDSIMSPVVGSAACDMESTRPESRLSNLLSDILIWAAGNYGESPIFSIYNIGGIRSTFSQGEITVGDVIDVAPFENKICFMTLKGKDVTELFQQIAIRGGEGVSHAVKAVITKDGKLLSLTLNGEAVNPDAEYRIATIDYLAEGNDGMPAFKKGTQRNMPKEDRNNLRFIIIDYLKHLKSEGKSATSELEGRITEEK